jgi:hypothetical protein
MEKKVEQIEFAIEGIKTEQFAIIENVDREGQYLVNTSSKFGIHKEDNALAAFINFQFISKEKVFMILEVSCHFKIADKSWTHLLKKNKIAFPRTAVVHFSMITVGTARGILHAKTENTEFNKYLIPTIDVNQLITGDLMFDFSQLK